VGLSGSLEYFTWKFNTTHPMRNQEQKPKLLRSKVCLHYYYLFFWFNKTRKALSKCLNKENPKSISRETNHGFWLCSTLPSQNPSQRKTRSEVLRDIKVVALGFTCLYCVWAWAGPIFIWIGPKWKPICIRIGLSSLEICHFKRGHFRHYHNWKYQCARERAPRGREPLRLRWRSLSRDNEKRSETDQ
jgi:hypothetical protein